MQHPNYDQFWKERNILPNLKNISAAMTVGGWYDNEDLFGALKTYQYIEKQNPGIFNVLVMGPWFHGGWARRWRLAGHGLLRDEDRDYYREHFELPFFNHFLKDKGDISEIKEVNVFDTGKNEWTSFDSWNPKAGVAETPIYLNAERISSRGYRAVQLVQTNMSLIRCAGCLTRRRSPADYPADFMTEDQRFASHRSGVLDLSN